MDIDSLKLQGKETRLSAMPFLLINYLYQTLLTIILPQKRKQIKVKFMAFDSQKSSPQCNKVASPSHHESGEFQKTLGVFDGCVNDS